MEKKAISSDIGQTLIGQGSPPPAVRGDGDSENSATLHQYTKDKFAISHELRVLENFFRGRESEERAAQCHELMVKLAEDRFTLAVVGQFKRGKSSLMNAVIGHELLPTGVLPLTSAITILRYGPREQLVVTWQDSDFDRTEPLSALNDYVTEQGNPGNEKKVRAVYVEVPSPFLRRGLEFVDTPGVGSAIEANTATTYSFIPNCDAVVFVTGVDAPMTEAELDFLRRLRRDVGKVFCVVNKIDLLGDSQRSQVIGFVTSQIQNALGSANVAVFPVSSRLALSGGAIPGNHSGRESGIDSFREALGRFLSGERTTVLFQAIIERTLKLLAAEQDDIRLAQRSASMSAEARQQRAEEMKSRFDATRRAIAEYVASVSKNTRTAIIDSGIANLDERIRLGIVGFAEGLLKSSAMGDWGSAKSLVEVVGRSVQDDALMVANEWLANRRHIANFELAEIAAALQKMTIKLLAEIGSDDRATPGSKHRPEEFKLAFEDATVDQFCIRVSSWSPQPPRMLRYMPASAVRRPLSKWIRQSAESYGNQLKEKARGLLCNFVTEQITELNETTMAFVQKEENRLTNLIVSPTRVSPAAIHISLAKQEEKANQIEDVLVLLLRSVGGITEPPLGARRTHKCDSEAQPFLPEYAPPHVTEEILTRNLRAGGCPICRLLARVLFDFFANWQHLVSADDVAQRRYAEERGFCPLHTWQLASISSPRGMSAGYPKLTERIRGDLQKLGDGEAAVAKLAKRITHPGSCRVCGMLASLEEDCVNGLNNLLKSDTGRRSYAAAHGVCLRHLPSLLGAVADAQTRHFLIDEAATYLELLGEDMQSFALKQEATRRELINSNEYTALRIALERTVGLKALCFPWEFDEVS